MKCYHLFLIPLLLAGCATVSEPPLEGNATVEFSQAGEYPILLFRVLTNGSDCSSPERVPPESNFLQNRFRPLIVPSNQEVAFSASWSHLSGVMMSSCNSVISFTPKAGAKYRIRYFADSATCGARVYELKSDGADLQEVIEPSARKRIPNLPFLATGPFCKVE